MTITAAPRNRHSPFRGSTPGLKVATTRIAHAAVVPRTTSGSCRASSAEVRHALPEEPQPRSEEDERGECKLKVQIVSHADRYP